MEPDVRERILHLYVVEGKGLNTVAKELEIDRRVIRSVVAKAGELRQRPTTYSIHHPKIRKAIRLLKSKQAKTMKDVSQQVGVARKTLYNHIKRYHPELIGKSRHIPDYVPTPQEIEEAKERIRLNREPLPDRPVTPRVPDVLGFSKFHNGSPIIR